MKTFIISFAIISVLFIPVQTFCESTTEVSKIKSMKIFFDTVETDYMKMVKKSRQKYIKDLEDAKILEEREVTYEIATENLSTIYLFDEDEIDLRTEEIINNIKNNPTLLNVSTMIVSRMELYKREIETMALWNGVSDNLFIFNEEEAKKVTKSITKASKIWSGVTMGLSFLLTTGTIASLVTDKDSSLSKKTIGISCAVPIPLIINFLKQSSNQEKINKVFNELHSKVSKVGVNAFLSNDLRRGKEQMVSMSTRTKIENDNIDKLLAIKKKLGEKYKPDSDTLKDSSKNITTAMYKIYKSYVYDINSERNDYYMQIANSILDSNNYTIFDSTTCTKLIGLGKDLRTFCNNTSKDFNEEKKIMTEIEEVIKH